MRNLISCNITVVDCEVFSDDWIVVLLDLKKRNTTIIKNNPGLLADYYFQHKDDVYVGYNIKNYDQYILKHQILAGISSDYEQNPKSLNDWIIKQDKMGYLYADGTSDDPEFPNSFGKIKLNIFDVMQNFPMGTSLKKLEAFMGESIDETSVSFDIGRKLTEEELDAEARYCYSDVINTAKVFVKKIDDYKSQVNIIETFDLDFTKGLKATKPFLSAMALQAERQDLNDEWNITWPSEKLQLGKYAFVEEWFKGVVNRYRDGETILSEVNINGKKMLLPKSYNPDELTFSVGEVIVTVALGGIHGAVNNYFEEGTFINFDVQSYYPSDMIVNNHCSRAIKDTSIFKDIYDTRIGLKAEAAEAKKAKNYKLADEKKAAQAPYKLILNSTYGAMGAEFNPLYDPKMMHSVCVSGQLMLLDLMDKLEGKCEFVQVNTDGVLVKLTSDNKKELLNIADEWSERTGMILETECYRAVYQRDVNNYIAVAEDGKTIKSKGADVKAKSDLDNDLPIINEAVSNALVNGIEPSKFINQCNDYKKFQKIYTVSKNYESALYGDRPLSNKVFRVFASKDEKDPCLYHKKADDAEKNPGQISKFADCPEHCFIDNSCIKDKPIPEKLDKEWYIALAERKLEAFKKGSNSNKTIKELNMAKAVTDAALNAPTPEEGAIAAINTVISMSAKPKKA